MIIRPCSVFFLVVALPAQELTRFPAPRAAALLQAWVATRAEQQVSVAYRLSRTTDGSGIPDSQVDEWIISGTPERWDGRRTRKFPDGRTRELDVWRGGDHYRVVVEGNSKRWEAVEESRNLEEYETVCPLQRSWRALGKSWNIALGDHSPVEGIRRADTLEIRMPMIPNLAEIIGAGQQVRNFVCWGVVFSTEAGVLKDMLRVVGYGSRFVTDPEAVQRTLDNPQALAPWTEATPAVLERVDIVETSIVEFGEVVSIRGCRIPTKMHTRSRAGSGSVAMLDLREVSRDEMEQALEFRVPEDMGGSGTLRSKDGKVRVFDKWPGTEQEAMEQLLAQGKPVASPGLPMWIWVLLGVALGVGLAVGVYVLPRTRRR